MSFFSSIDLFQSDEELKVKFMKVFESMKSFFVHNDFIVTHAPCEKKYLGKISNEALKMARGFRYPKERDYEDFAGFMCEFDEKTKFMRDDANELHPIHIFGHVMTKDISQYKNKINIDTGCVAGGSLSSIEIENNRKFSTKFILSINKSDKRFYNFFI